MKLATWNVNSIRARLPRVIPWLMAAQPDVLCMQELKVGEDEFPFDAFDHAGYAVALAGQRTYNGVGIAVRRPLAIEDVTHGFDDGEDDSQARLIAATVGGVRVLSAYFPNGQSVGSDKYEYKLRWMERLRAHLDRFYRPSQPILLCGDFNVAPEPRDVCDPAFWSRTTLFHETSRDALAKIRAWGFQDAFRLHHEEAGAYSWWDYRMLSFAKGRGLRIDHVFVSDALAPQVTASFIDREARKGQAASDHAPVVVDVADRPWPRVEPPPRAPRVANSAPPAPEEKRGQGSLF